MNRAADIETEAPSAKRPWAGYIVSALPTLFLLMDAVVKLIKPAVAVEATVELGYSEGIVVPLGIVLLICTVLYIVPKTSILGAILLTGYLGGAVATHARISNPVFTHTLFPVYLGILLWLGLFLRDERVRRLIPFRTEAPK
jgi:hypothetical protein